MSLISEPDPASHYECSFNSDWYKCRTCQFTTNNKISLYVHHRCIHEKLACLWLKDFAKVQKCEVCLWKPSSSIYLLRHVCPLRVDNRPWLQCEYCDFQTKKGGPLSLHISKLHTTKSIAKLNCDKCEYVAKDRHELKSHYSWHRQQRRKQNSPWLDCGYCDFKTKYKQTLDKHSIKKHARPKQTVCKYTTKPRTLQNEHTTVNKQIEYSRWHCCEQCDFITKTKSLLNIHVKRNHIKHIEDNCFKCELCAFSCKFKHGLQRHVIFKHTPDDKIEWRTCKFCEKKFKSSSNIAGHVRRMHKDML